MKPPLLRDESFPERAPDLDRLVDARSQWLTEAVTRLRARPFVTGAWLYGSLAAGAGDAYSDIDLVVAVDDAMPVAVLEDPVAGLDLPGQLLFSRAKPRNAPAGGGYRGVCVEAAGLPLLVDLCVWPAATAAVPSDGRLLYARSDPPRSQLGFMTLLDGHRSSDTRGADAGAPENVLYLVQLAAKYLSRGDTSRQTAINQQMHLPPPADVGVLRRVVDERVDLIAHPGLCPAVQAAHRLLNMAAAGAVQRELPVQDRVPDRTCGEHPAQQGEL